MKKRETSDLEYKSSISNSFLKTISAYANYGDGTIIFGVTDNGEIVGIKNPVDECLNIENKINDNVSPIPEYILDLNEKNNTITLKVFEGIHKPYVYKNKAYKRSDSSTIEVDRIEFNRLVLEGANQNFEELPSFHKDLSFNYLESKLKDELNISELNNDILKTLNLYSDKIGYNRAAELISDKNNFSGVNIVRFGENIDEFLDRESLEGISVIEQYDRAVNIFIKYYQYEVIEGFERKKVELIPEKAFREALANGIVHRTWDVGSSTNISMYKDRIEISSPGGLPVGISREEYLNAQISILRNPILGNVFYRLRYIEKFGTGIRRINYAYAKSKIKPEYRIYDNSIVVVLPIFSEDSAIFDKDERLIFDILKGKIALTRIEIEEKTNFNKDKVIRVLNRLIEKNSIERIGQGRGIKYRRL